VIGLSLGRKEIKVYATLKDAGVSSSNGDAMVQGFHGGFDATLVSDNLGQEEAWGSIGVIIRFFTADTHRFWGGLLARSSK